VTVEEGQTLRAALGQLKKLDRQLIERLFWEGRSEAEIASESGISQQAANRRKQRILRELRRTIEKK
jgi:DNA-directed RNA polymerase specialized sigma24 family protein